MCSYKAHQYFDPIGNFNVAHPHTIYKFGTAATKVRESSKLFGSCKSAV